MRSIAAAFACALLLSSAAVAQQGRHVRAVPLMTVQADERPVELTSAHVTVEPMAGLARTTIEMEFRNPNARVLEGNLQFPLRPAQQVVGFAVDVDGRMREAVPVEKEKGRRVFEAIEREGIDPGLLEQTAGEFFRLRVYPFAPGASRRVRITLAEPLATHAHGHAVTVPLAFARDLGQVEVDVVGAAAPRIEGTLRPLATDRMRHGLHRVRVARSDLRPDGGLRVVVPATATPVVQVQARGDARYFLAEVPVADAMRPRELPPRIAIVWDSSMSGAKRAHDLEFALLDRYFRAAGDVEVDLVRLRDAAEPAKRFAVRGGEWQRLRDELARTVYDGATSADGWTADAGVGEVLLFGDGLFNYGAGTFPTLREGQRLYAIRAGVPGNAARLAALANERGGRAIALDEAGDLDRAAGELLRDGVRLVGIDAVGATDLRAESPHAVGGRLRVTGRITGAQPRVLLRLAGRTAARTVDVPLDGAIEGGMAGWAWARYGLAAMQADPERNREAIASLGRRFGLVTPQTSLIVLERPADYVRHDIAPPPELAAEVAALTHERGRQRDKARGDRIDHIARQWRERIEWWETPFPKTAPPRAVAVDRPILFAAEATDAAAEAADTARTRQERASQSRLAAMAPMPIAPPPAPPAPPTPGSANALDRVAVTGSRISDSEAGAATIVLRPWASDSALARRLRAADADAVYPLYLDARDGQAGSTAFFLDVADVLFSKQQDALALRVLSNLAELQLEDRHVLRVLAHRLQQAGRADLALPVFERVLAIGEEEPQSWRDLALAHAALGNRQKAIDLLYEVVIGEWDRRFADIEMTALAELNALVATASAPLDTSRVHTPLLRSLPLELRAVLSWDSDNSDMDLWVTDPNGEKAYYGNRLTYQGGRMSRDFTGGYGPEEFALRDAKPGTYRVEANFFGDRQQLVTGATTLQLWLSTGFGTPRQKDRAVTLRLADRKETVLVGEFEVK